MATSTVLAKLDIAGGVVVSEGTSDAQKVVITNTDGEIDSSLLGAVVSFPYTVSAPETLFQYASNEILGVDSNGNIILESSTSSFGFNSSHAPVIAGPLIITELTTAGVVITDASGVIGSSGAPTISGANLTALPTTIGLYPILNQNTTGRAGSVGTGTYIPYLTSGVPAAATYAELAAILTGGNGTLNLSGYTLDLTAGQIPLLNQNTTGSAGSFTGSLVGDVVGTQGATVVEKLNGVLLASLATGLLKNTVSTGEPTIAVEGTDYAPPTSGLAILHGNNAGGFSNVTIGSGLSFDTGTGTLSSTVAGGTVESFTAGNLSPLFTTTVSSSTTNPDLTFTLDSAAQNSVFAGPASGGAGLPSFQTAPTISGANLTALPTSTGLYPTLNQNTTGSAGSFTGTLLGDVTGTQGATVVGKINGTSLATLTTGLLKNTTSTGVPVIATAGTDYAAPTSGQAILYGNNAGGFSNVTVSTGLNFNTGTGTLTSTALISPMTALGDTIVGGTSGTPTRLAGYTAANEAVLTQTGTGSASANPAWANAPSISGANLTALPTSTGLYPTLNQNTSGNAAGFTGSLVGDVTGTQGATVVGKINGTSLATLATGLLKNTTSTGIPSIATAGTDYVVPAGTVANFSGSLSGDVSGTQSATTVTKINGTSLAALTTGLLKNTTSTGVPTIATAGTDYVIPSGTVTNFSGSLSGDVTGTQSSTTVVKINGTTLSSLATGILKNTTSTGVPVIATAGTDYVTPSGNITGTAANLSGTPTVPNGTSATTQAIGDNSNKLATTAAIAQQTGSAGPIFTRNRFENGQCRQNQRGNAYTNTSVTTAAQTAALYFCDRFYMYATGAAVTYGQVTAPGSNFQYGIQITGAGSNTGVTIGQRIEATNIYDLAGTTVTISVWVKASAITTLNIKAYYPGTTDTWTSTPTTISSSNFSNSGSWTINSTLNLYTTTLSVPSNCTAGLAIEFSVGAMTSGTLVLTGMQLEAGSVTTPFERLPIQMELERCQRYYCTRLVSIQTQVASYLIVPYFYPVVMRAVPTCTTLSGGTQTNISVPLAQYSGDTSGSAIQVYSTAANGLLTAYVMGFSAEL